MYAFKRRKYIPEKINLLLNCYYQGEGQEKKKKQKNSVIFEDMTMPTNRQICHFSERKQSLQIFCSQSTAKMEICLTLWYKHINHFSPRTYIISLVKNFCEGGRSFGKALSKGRYPNFFVLWGLFLFCWFSCAQREWYGETYSKILLLKNKL